jgi:DNA-binding PadR family transcriptional regulator
MTDEPDPAAHTPLHPQEFRVLLALLSGPSFGTQIVKEIEERHGGGTKFYPANLFRRVRDLLARKLVEECDPPPGADPRRTYVRLTKLGRAVVRREAQRLDELVREARAHQLLPERGK